MPLYFQGTHFFDLNRLTYRDGRSLEDVCRMLHDYSYGKKAHWRSAGSFDNLNILDFGPGKTAQDEEFQAELRTLSATHGKELDRIYAFSPKSFPGRNAHEGDSFAYAMRDGQWVLTNQPIPSDTMTVDELVEIIQPLHTRKGEEAVIDGKTWIIGGGAGHGGSVSSTLYALLCKKLGLRNPFEK